MKFQMGVPIGTVAMQNRIPFVEVQAAVARGELATFRINVDPNGDVAGVSPQHLVLIKPDSLEQWLAARERAHGGDGPDAA